MTITTLELIHRLLQEEAAESAAQANIARSARRSEESKDEPDESILEILRADEKKASDREEAAMDALCEFVAHEF